MREQRSWRGGRSCRGGGQLQRRVELLQLRPLRPQLLEPRGAQQLGARLGEQQRAVWRGRGGAGLLGGRGRLSDGGGAEHGRHEGGSGRGPAPVLPQQLTLEHVLHRLPLELGQPRGVAETLGEGVAVDLELGDLQAAQREYQQPAAATPH